MKMIISAGGTGGHIYPALAIISKFQKSEKDFEVLYIGTHNRMENKIVPEKNIPYQAIKIYGFNKRHPFKDIANIKHVIVAYKECRQIIKNFQPDIVVGVGGYVTLPVIMAARAEKKLCVIHEQNSIPGKTNKFLSRGVNAVFTSFKDSNKYFAKEVNCIYTGNPSGDNILNEKPLKKESLGFSKDKKLLLITSGSLGSSGLNEKLNKFLELSEKEDYEVLFITGKENYEETVKNNHFAKNIKVIPYLDNLSSLFSSCDLIIARAGAGTLAEILMAKIPSIIIPSPNVANNHQYYNALSLEKENLAIMIEEKNLDSDELYKRVKELFQNNAEYQKLQKNLSQYKNIKSSDIIYKEIKELIEHVK